MRILREAYTKTSAFMTLLFAGIVALISSIVHSGYEHDQLLKESTVYRSCIVEASHIQCDNKTIDFSLLSNWNKTAKCVISDVDPEESYCRIDGTNYYLSRK